MIDTTQTLKNLQGESLMIDDTQELTLGKALGAILINFNKSAQNPDPLRSFILAQEYYKEGEIKPSDISFVKNLVKTTTAYGPLVTGQILSILESDK